MAFEVVWTYRAKTGFEKIIHYLKENFGQKEVNRFVKESFDFFELLTEFPEILQKSDRLRNVHRGPINKFTILTYRVRARKMQIELLNIRSARLKPVK